MPYELHFLLHEGGFFSQSQPVKLLLNSRTYWCAVTAILCGGQCNEAEVLFHRSKVCLLSQRGHELLGSTQQNTKREKVNMSRKTDAILCSKTKTYIHIVLNWMNPIQQPVSRSCFFLRSYLVTDRFWSDCLTPGHLPDWGQTADL